LKKLKTALLALVATLAVVFGGMAAATPAQAVTGSTVYLFGAAGNGWVKTTNTNGVDKIIHQYETANNVQFFCPPSSGWEMVIYGPNGTKRNVAPGLCYFPTNPGTYQVGVYYANS
jgi:hypothetical protein